MSDSPGLVDFANVLVTSVLNLPKEQVKFLGEFKNYRRTVINPASKQNLQGSWNDLGKYKLAKACPNGKL